MENSSLIWPTNKEMPNKSVKICFYFSLEENSRQTCVPWFHKIFFQYTVFLKVLSEV